MTLKCWLCPNIQCSQQWAASRQGRSVPTSGCFARLPGARAVFLAIVDGPNWVVQGTRPDNAFDVIELSSKFKTVCLKDLNQAKKTYLKLKGTTCPGYVSDPGPMEWASWSIVMLLMPTCLMAWVARMGWWCSWLILVDICVHCPVFPKRFQATSAKMADVETFYVCQFHFTSAKLQKCYESYTCKLS